MSDLLDHWLDGRGDERQGGQPPDVTDIFVQLDCLHDERAERRDPRWHPPGEYPENLERLVAERYARGLLRTYPLEDKRGR